MNFKRIMTSLLLAVITIEAHAWEIVPMPRRIAMTAGTPLEATVLACENTGGFTTAAKKVTTFLTERQVKIDPTAKVKIIFTTDHALGPEAYTIEITSDYARITAADAAGAWYAAATLTQIMTVNGGKVSLSPGKIEDAPALKMRGALLFLDNMTANETTMTNLKNLIRALAELKYNTLFMMFADNLQYDTVQFPGRRGKAFAKNQVRELLAVAEACHIKVIPYFQTMSHCPWILSNPAHRKWLEDPAQTGWNVTWCPSNPEVKKFFTAILKETAELFHPEYIHLGFDEIGAWRQCEKCKAQPADRLLSESITYYHDYLKTLGIKTIIYQDELLAWNPEARAASRAQAWKAREQLPRDITINIWYYAPSPQNIAAQIKTFTGLGYPVIGAGFNNPAAIQEMCRRLAELKPSSGMMATFWHYVGSWGTGEISSAAAALVTVSAEYAWNPDGRMPGEIHYDPVRVFMSRYFPASASNNSVKEIPLTGNTTFGNNADQWPGNTFGREFGVPGHIQVDNQLLFTWGQTARRIAVATKDNAVAVASPSAVANRLGFVHSCGIPGGEISATGRNYPRLGQYRVEYQDGTSVNIPLQYRWNIIDWNNCFSAMNYRGTCAAITADGASQLQFGLWFWDNPSPQKIIKQIWLECDGKGIDKIVCAAVLIDDPSQPAAAATNHPVDKESKARPQAPPDALWSERFAYSSLSQLQANWQITADLKRLELKRFDGGWQAVWPGGPEKTLSSPAFDCNVEKLMPQLLRGGGELMVNSTFPEGIKCGFYLGDSKWNNYIVSYMFVMPGVNRIRFNYYQALPESGKKLQPEKFTKFRMRFFLADAPGALNFSSLNFYAYPLTTDWRQ